jgi:uncharacterized protein (TIGR03435 family)
MQRVCFRFLSRVALVATGLAMSVPSPPRLCAQAQAPERLPIFEVASVKKNTSDDSRAPMRTYPGGRLVVTNARLKVLIAVAFSVVDPESLIDSRVLGGPDWVDSERYDINAKSSTEFRPSPDGPDPEMILMLRSLLEERFKLRAHRETRELPIFELVVARADGKLGPGLHKSAVDCDALIAAGNRPPREPGEPPPCGLMGGPARTIAGGATMQQFAANLAVRSERLVVDKTGLAGRFAFTLAWTPDRMPTGTPPPGVPPIDPDGPSIFTALQEQLGLKLKPARGPVDVLVIDRVERLTPD